MAPSTEKYFDTHIRRYNLTSWTGFGTGKYTDFWVYTGQHVHSSRTCSDRAVDESSCKILVFTFPERCALYALIRHQGEASQVCGRCCRCRLFINMRLESRAASIVTPLSVPRHAAAASQRLPGCRITERGGVRRSSHWLVGWLAG